jgi:gas vesicle protein
MNNLVSSFMVGAGIGCGVALLAVSKPGRKLRARLGAQASRAAASIKRSGMELRGQAVDLARKGSQSMATQKEALSAGLEAGKRAYARAARS